MQVSLVIPTFNEEENLRFLLGRIPPFVDEVLVVDSSSTDGSAEVARLSGAEVISAGAGKGVALRTGMQKAQGEIIITMDGDCSQLPEELGRFVEAIQSGYDIVIGSRFLDGGGSDEVTLFRRLGILLFRSMINLIWKTHYTDVNYGFRAFRKKCIQDLQLKSNGFDIDVEVVIHAARKRIKILEIPCHENKRKFGRAKLGILRDGLSLFWGIIRELFER